MIGGGRYTLRQEIGRGGDGIVWLANDEHLQQLVAIKRLPSELTNNAVALKDLIGEVQKARMLSHPNIIRIHDFVKLPDEPPFITMEFVDGSDLNSLRSQQPNGYFTWERLEGLAIQLCESLEYAHAQQIIHRDLKPANMMITRDGNLKLADFGIAASVADTGLSPTPEGDSSGTMVYMSPQQMQGKTPHPTDDIYSLGATLYDLLTTRPPFYTGDIFQLTQEVLPPTISQRLHDFEMENHVPPHVENAIMTCLSKDHANRPAHARDLIALLHPGDQPPPPPPSPTEFIPEMESVLAEPLEKTQKYLEENLPEPITSWWSNQNTSKRDITLTCCVIIGLLVTEIIYSKFAHEKFFETIINYEFFRPWR
jgi:serine/threonine protein kinase